MNKIISNYHKREFLYYHELTDKNKKDLVEYEGIENSIFFVYRGFCYNLSDFMAFRLNKEEDRKFLRWDGYLGESYFSGIVFKKYDESIIVGHYYTMDDE